MTNEVVEVLAFVLQSVTQADGTLIFQMMTNPATMLLEDCIKIAHEVNNNPDIPNIIMCMPPILPTGAPV